MEYIAVIAPGALLWWFSAFYPSRMPFWMPWEFSWCEYLAMAFLLLWFFHGLALAPRAARLPAWRRILFLSGLTAIYAVTQTRFDYMAQHMFFLNRIQHVAMHHLGPFLIALGGAGETIGRGMPPVARRIVKSRFAAALVNHLQKPLPAVFLFSGLFYFWLIPPVHFHAMLNAHLYQLMNWSMTLDGVLFWTLALDLRPKPPARLSFAVRLALCVAVIFPQIVLGALLAFSRYDLYPSYALCGRLFPSITALDDQNIGGIIVWIPPAMMSVIGALLLMNAYRLHETATTSRSPYDAISSA